ncbi:hypothetical protein [Pseudonocardia phyllosphaerae]|uniref:hypothetical protein n=1 Tax=Pseudonocardia phyllosphaerae TaxID=3390502 RepID=UPI00397881AD
MRKSVRTLLASALAVPMTLGFAGVAMAHGDHGHGHPGDKNQIAGSSSVIDQESSTDQKSTNFNFAPVTQVNPAVNVPILNLGGGGAIVQDNSVDSSNTQGNAAETNQDAKSKSKAGNAG